MMDILMLLAPNTQYLFCHKLTQEHIAQEEAHVWEESKHHAQQENTARI